MSGPINGYMNHAAAPAPPPRGLLIKSTGLLTAVSPLCTWLLWDTLPAAALLAPLFLVSIFAGTARAMKKKGPTYLTNHLTDHLSLSII